MYTGWKQKEDGRWFYYKDDKAIRNNWFKDKDGRWYYFNNDGSMHKGWLWDKAGYWCYLAEKPSGAFKEGQAYQNITVTFPKWGTYKFYDTCYGLLINSINQGKVSDNLVSFTANCEGLRLNAYKDCKGIWTIGYGTTGAVVNGIGNTIKTCTKQQATEWLGIVLNRCASQVFARLKSIEKTDLEQNKFDVLVDMAYNLGISGFPGMFTLLQQKANDTIICNKLMEYTNHGIPGLVKRCKGRCKIWTNSDYSSIY